MDDHANDGYHLDFVAWTQRQAASLRAGDIAALDWQHLAEEIESLGASERRELRRRLARLLQHLLRWQFDLELRSRSWTATIRAQRDEIAAVLEDSPSLRPTVAAMLPRAFTNGRAWAAEETGLLNLPTASPWTVEQVLSPDFIPE